MALRLCLSVIAALLIVGPTSADEGEPDDEAMFQETRALLSPEYLECVFSEDSPLNSTVFPCLDKEFHRLDAQLTVELSAALARQPSDEARSQVQERANAWSRLRFEECADAAEDLSGSTAAVIVEACEIDVLAKRIVWLRHH